MPQPSFLSHPARSNLPSSLTPLAEHSIIGGAADPWSAGLSTSGGEVNANSLLDKFNLWMQTSGYSKDVAALFSGREFQGTTIGLAGIGVMCSTRAASVNQFFGSNSESLAKNAATFAHELAHKYGSCTLRTPPPQPRLHAAHLPPPPYTPIRHTMLCPTRAGRAW